MVDIGQRKVDHLELCATDDVAFRGRTTLLEHVQLIHQSLPELAFDDVDTSVMLLGKRLRAPLLIAAMTGGSAPSAEVNHTLSAIAEARGYGFGLGSPVQLPAHRRRMLRLGKLKTLGGYFAEDTFSRLARRVE